MIPVEVPGVIGVTANGATRQTDGDDDPDDYLKSFYSSFGISEADVVAPGGDSRFGITPPRPLTGASSRRGRRRCGRCPAALGRRTRARRVYCYLQGTSMAGPHVAGVAALIVSRYGDAKTPQNGTMRPGQVAALLAADGRSAGRVRRRSRRATSPSWA